MHNLVYIKTKHGNSVSWAGPTIHKYRHICNNMKNVIYNHHSYRYVCRKLPRFQIANEVPYVGKYRTNISHTGTFFYICINLSYRIKIGFVIVYVIVYIHDCTEPTKVRRLFCIIAGISQFYSININYLPYFVKHMFIKDWETNQAKQLKIRNFRRVLGYFPSTRNALNFILFLNPVYRIPGKKTKHP